MVLPAAVGLSPAVTATNEQRRIMAALTGYALSLQALTNVADRQAFDAASAQVTTATQTLASLASLATPAATVAPVVVTAVLSVVGQGLDYERYRRLRRAVQEAHPAIVSLAPTVAQVISANRSVRLDTLKRTLEAVVDGMPRQSGSANRLLGQDIALERSAALNGLATVDPEAIARGVVTAHAALREALEDRERGFENLRTAVEGFARQAAVWRASLTPTNAQ